MRKVWSDSERQTLRRMWPHYPATVIGVRLGRPKSSIIGQAHRMGLESKAPLRGKVRLEPPIIEAPLEPELEPVYEGPVPILEAKGFHCRAVLDQRGPDGLVMFCGKLIVAGQAFSFCSEHLHRYTTRGYAR